MHALRELIPGNYGESIMSRRVAIVACSVLVSLAPLLQAQQIPSLGETIDIAIVNVDVVVTDRDGKRVRGLTQNDFEIYENGRLQPITNFAEYRDDALSGTARLGTAKEEEVPQQPRTLVLFLEPFRTVNFRAEPFIESLKKLVRDSMRPGDAVSIITFDSDTEVRVAPTDDVEVALRELDAFGEQLVGVRVDKAGHVQQDADALREFERDAAAFAGVRGIRRQPTSDREIVNMAARSAAAEADLQMRRRVAAINAVINGLAGVEGKKALIVAAHRLGSFAGAEYFYSAGNSTLPPGETDEFDNRDRMKALIANANAAGVSLYPIFPAGLDQTSADPAVRDITREVLLNEMSMRQVIAKETGGLTTYGAVEIAKLLPEITGDLSNYYSLAYRVRATREDEARKLVVRTKNRNLEVRARSQFVEKSEESRMNDRLAAAMYGMPVESAIAVNATLGAVKKARRSRTVPVSVRIPIGALTLVPQERNHAGAFSVFVLAGGERAAVSDVTRRTQPFEIPSTDVARASASHFTYDVDVVLREGTEHIVVGVLDEVSKAYGVTRIALTP